MRSLLIVALCWTCCATQAANVILNSVANIDVTATNEYSTTNYYTFYTNFVFVTNSAAVNVTNSDVRATGQTTIYRYGDDGFYTYGSVWPNPRFTIGTGADTNTVLDNLTGLMWCRTPRNRHETWTAAIDYCEGLTNGTHEDWRIPNIREMLSIVQFQYPWLPIPDIDGTSHQWSDGDPFWTFSTMVTDQYWTGTTAIGFGTNTAMDFSWYTGLPGWKYKTNAYSGVMPVRGPD